MSKLSDKIAWLAVVALILITAITARANDPCEHKPVENDKHGVDGPDNKGKPDAAM